VAGVPVVLKIDRDSYVFGCQCCCAALCQGGRKVRYVLFGDDGDGIVKRENRAKLVAEIGELLTAALTTARAAWAMIRTCGWSSAW
jgi:hypothetical protein